MIVNNKLAAQFDPEMIKNKSVYLPESKGWYDFWSGKKFDGGQTIQVPAPIDIMPLFVKAGSIIPMGPFLQYATEKPADPIELRVYSGGNAEFTIYEDENDNYNYEKGAYATIPVNWDEAAKSLTIGERKGKFSGMIKNRKFNIVLVNENFGTGVEITSKPNQAIEYNGTLQVVKL